MSDCVVKVVVSLVVAVQSRLPRQPFFNRHLPLSYCTTHTNLNSLSGRPHTSFAGKVQLKQTATSHLPHKPPRTLSHPPYQINPSTTKFTTVVLSLKLSPIISPLQTRLMRREYLETCLFIIVVEREIRMYKAVTSKKTLYGIDV